MRRVQQKMVPAGSERPGDKPVVLDAVDATLRTIKHRMQLYRILVVGVILVSIGSLLSAVLLRQWLALSSLIALVPLAGGFLFCDSRLVRRWRTTILELERSRSMDVAMFRKTVSGFRHLPPSSLKAMLATLGPDREGARTQGSPHLPAGVDDFEARDQKIAGRILQTTTLLTCSLICLVAGASSGSANLLLLGGGLGAGTMALARSRI